MKKWCIVFVLIMLCGMSGCNHGNNGLESTQSNYYPDDNLNEEETEMDTNNKTIIAKALGVKEDARAIRFIINSLHTIDAGQIQSAELAEVDGEKVINLVAEDDTDYRIYLSKNGNVEAVKNLSTGDWPIQSAK